MAMPSLITCFMQEFSRQLFERHSFLCLRQAEIVLVGRYTILKAQTVYVRGNHLLASKEYTVA